MSTRAGIVDRRGRQQAPDTERPHAHATTTTTPIAPSLHLQGYPTANRTTPTTVTYQQYWRTNTDALRATNTHNINNNSGGNFFICSEASWRATQVPLNVSTLREQSRSFMHIRVSEDKSSCQSLSQGSRHCAHTKLPAWHASGVLTHTGSYRQSYSRATCSPHRQSYSRAIGSPPAMLQAS